MDTRLTRGVRTWSVGAILLLALALVLAACGDVDNNSTAVSAPIRPSPTATSAPAPANTTAAVASGGGAGAATTAAAGNSSAPGVDPALADAGAKLYSSVQPSCAGCHPNGGKNKGVGPVLLGTKRDDAYIHNQLKNGKGAMPAYPNLTDEQQNQLIAYIRSIK